jgi:prepilin-type processing-associated H-X9-DG protein
MDYDPANTDNINVTKLLTSTLGPYLKAAEVYKCPADHSVVKIGGGSHPRVRSMSMNSWMASQGFMLFSWGGQYRTLWKQAEITAPSPSQTFVFMDEREDSITDSRYIVDMDDRGSSARFYYQLPASYHTGSGNLSYADGHAEAKRWRDARTKPPLIKGKLAFGNSEVPSPNNADIAWLQEHATSRK